MNVATTSPTIACAVCAKQRPPDRRLPCPHCGKRPRDAGKGEVQERRLENEDLVVIASDPQELVRAQEALIARLDEKILQAERERAAAAVEPAELQIDQELNSATAKALVTQARDQLKESGRRLAAIAERRVVYLQKVREALAAGFVMVPTLPGHVIAVRTARARPAGRQYIWDVNRSADPSPVLPDPALPPGEGRYVAPMPEHEHQPRAGSDRQDIVVSGFDEQIALPVEFLKPSVVQRTARAIDLKIFDQIVLIRDGAAQDTFAGASQPPRGDPMVVGRVMLRRPGAHRWERPKVLSFLIAWFFDTKDIL